LRFSCRIPDFRHLYYDRGRSFGAARDVQSNAELIDAVLGGDTAPYAELMRRHQRLALTAAWRILGDYHAAEDAVQEAFVAAYQNLSRLRDRSLFGAWVIGIVRREAVRIAKRRHAAGRTEVMPDPPAGDDSARLQEDLQQLLAAVARLPEHERVVVILHYVDGQTVHAIAEMTDRPLGTVTKQLSRAVERLRQLLAEVER
jgi:RNA polymerase sigma-70 factor (ECF subfamily)